MKYEKLLNKVKKIKKGAYTSIAYERECKLKKAYSENIITKRTIGTVRLGIEYDNMKSVKDKRADGVLPSENQGLPWGKWKHFPYTIENNNKQYLRVATTPNKAITEYRLNGKVVSYDQIEPMLLASEKPKKDGIKLDVYTINSDDIISID